MERDFSNDRLVRPTNDSEVWNSNFDFKEIQKEKEREKETVITIRHLAKLSLRVNFRMSGEKSL